MKAQFGGGCARGSEVRSGYGDGAGPGASFGFTVIELLVALLIATVVCGSLAMLASDARAVFRVQPESADLLQRARLGHETLADALLIAGAGLQLGDEPKPLVAWIPTVLPYARGVGGSDPEMQAFRDRVTVLSVPDLAPQAALSDAMSTASDDVPIASSPPASGFAADQRVLLFDQTPAFDVASVRDAAASRVMLASASVSGTAGTSDPVSKPYRAADDAHIVMANVTTFSFDAARRQLRRASGDGVDMPVLDEVVDMSFRYFGDPIPPAGPRPPPGESNCLFDAAGITTLAVLADDDDGLAELPIESFTDGPFCGAAPYRFDADLYRVRRVRVRLRLQTASASLRGRDPLLFQLPGTASSARLQVPDMVLEFDIAPRNLQLR